VETITYATTDVDRARLEVARIFCAHRLRPEAGVRDVRLRLEAHMTEGVGVVDLDYGRAVHVQPDPLGTFFLVQMPRAGSAQVRYAGTTVTSDPGMGSVLSPDEPPDVRYAEGTPQRIFYIRRANLLATLEKHLGRPPEGPLDLAVGMPLTSDGARSWCRAVDFFAREFAHGGAASFLANRTVVRHVEEALLGQFLLVHHHANHRALSTPIAVASTTRVVRQACEFIHDRHDEPLTVGDVAQAVGVSVRTLQACFRKGLGTTPTQYLRSFRLEAAHATLEAAAPGSSVTEVAFQHGFAHLGRFAADYRARFGERPSDTMRR
jgi:AraC-like DNA-binding protein